MKQFEDFTASDFEQVSLDDFNEIVESVDNGLFDESDVFGDTTTLEGACNIEIDEDVNSDDWEKPPESDSLNSALPLNVSTFADIESVGKKLGGELDWSKDKADFLVLGDTFEKVDLDQNLWLRVWVLIPNILVCQMRNYKNIKTQEKMLLDDVH